MIVIFSAPRFTASSTAICPSVLSLSSGKRLIFQPNHMAVPKSSGLIESKSPTQMFGAILIFKQCETPLSAATIISQDSRISFTQVSIINSPPRITAACLGVLFKIFFALFNG